MPVVFRLSAFNDPLTAATLCNVCNTARNWMLPILYENITLTTPAEIERFALSLRGASPSSELHGPRTALRNAATYVSRLWIGATTTLSPPTMEPFKARLHPASASTWPIPAIRMILAVCTSLRAFALIHAPYDVYRALLLHIPATVEALALGPAHARVDWERLPCAEIGRAHV